MEQSKDSNIRPQRRETGSTTGLSNVLHAAPGRVDVQKPTGREDSVSPVDRSEVILDGLTPTSTKAGVTCHKPKPSITGRVLDLILWPVIAAALLSHLVSLAIRPPSMFDHIVYDP